MNSTVSMYPIMKEEERKKNRTKRKMTLTESVAKLKKNLHSSNKTNSIGTLFHMLT